LLNADVPRCSELRDRGDSAVATAIAQAGYSF